MHRSSALRVAISLALILTLTPVSLAHAATVDELRAHERAARDARKAAEAAQNEADRLSKEVEALDQEMAAIQMEITGLADDVATATDRADRLRAEVSALQAQIVARQAEIDATQAEYERQKALLNDRVQTTYKNSDFIYFDLLLGSRSIDDFINRTTLVQRVIRSNEGIAHDLKDTRISIEKAKAQLEQELQSVDQKKTEAEAEETRVKDLRAQYQAKLKAQQAAEGQKQSLIAENTANAERLRAAAEAEDAESSKIASELYGHGSGYFAGVMAFPVPGFEQVPTGGSAFGWRIHPILGTRKMHTGIDIGGSAVGKNINGAAIVAAADGKVIFAGPRSGYGNTVIIDHGNGVTTLYAHQQSGGIKVSVGQHVNRRDRIGTVGSTGLSTGPHLHFEVRVNGDPRDPMQYLQ